ncbi:permease-like cell division protein FtsX [Actinoplanes sp. TFC3]|uniref:permease-like cell division protein FtsX n=1 Tax=Actinoplanes sp. TFC3 TaxID=1710355 RepID=UPI000835F030|nr:permease-like cell division protein FtsX [Actinoplanes sp. TFC3]
MRRLTLLLTVLTVVALSGCGLLKKDNPEDELGFKLDDVAEFSVFLRDDVTDAQRTQLQTSLQALPEVSSVRYESKDEAYRKFKDLWADDPDFIKSVSPDALPESFRIKLASMARLREFKGGQVETDLKAIPGVQEVVFPICTTVDECKQQKATMSPAPK